ncbi:Pentatricopeptide repeat-containing protein [Thalictrum thalictroides]|uniref:Pentatricopeptide repeat-containing protein n=1 Tax=Thalictrum thalictroides TaxID=46969 RepID=A0A7J6VQQ2_THATH|nr:Pentatricopeptide repeat-containing protein [Thalictrum thalictroides]
MLLSKAITASRVIYLSPVFTKRFITSSSFYSLNPFLPRRTLPIVEEKIGYDSKEIAFSIKSWFKRKDDIVIDRIFEILARNDSNGDAELELSQLKLKLNEGFVLKVLNQGKDVLSCLKFFDWSGRQNGYFHTRATFNAIFKILSREKLMSLMLDFLDNFRSHKGMHRVRFYDTLVVGYAVAGKPDIALHLFGTMRFQGLDLNPFSYHVFVNALVEQSCFFVAEVIFKQICLRGLESEITSCIRVKSFCKQDKLQEGVAFLHGLESRGLVVNDYMVSTLVDAHCKMRKFAEARRLMEDFWGLAKIEHADGLRSRDLVQAGKIDGAMNFLRTKKLLEGYVPDVFRYNTLICRLLRENRLNDVFDLLMEMIEENIFPDRVTMNAALCFFCKAGMVDVALELYNSRSEFGLSLNSLSYNYLINTLVGDGSVDEAYQVLKDSIKQGWFPVKKTASIIAEALCREGKLDKVWELVIMALEQNVMPSDAVCVKFISGLCKANRVEDGYMIYGELNRVKKLTYKYTFFDLVRGFSRLNRGDMAATLLIEMQENGHRPSRELYRAVLCCICNMDNPEQLFFKLLELQLSHQEPDCHIYNFFIDGSGHAKRPDLARKVYELMVRNGIEPNNTSKLLIMQSYLKGERVADAMNFYYDLCDPSRKLNNAMVVGLCKANKPGLGLELLRKLREKRLLPSLECYEELVRSFCTIKNYDLVVEVIDELLKTGRYVSSFIGNLLLLHSLKSRELYRVLVQSGFMTRRTSESSTLTLGELVGLFSGAFRKNSHKENFDEIIEQCFPPDTFTYNMLLRRLSMAKGLDKFVEMFHKMVRRGYQPNRMTYDIIVHGLLKHGRRHEALKWMDEAQRRGFDLTENTKYLL